jgi:hypothetical protein
VFKYKCHWNAHNLWYYYRVTSYFKISLTTACYLTELLPQNITFWGGILKWKHVRDFHLEQQTRYNNHDFFFKLFGEKKINQLEANNENLTSISRTWLQESQVGCSSLNHAGLNTFLNYRIYLLTDCSISMLVVISNCPAFLSAARSFYQSKLTGKW